MSITKPTLLPVPFAISGAKNTIPIEADTTPGKSNYASYNLGFPPVTMIPVEAGGIPPEGMDLNGVFFDATDNIRYANAGGQYWFDADFAAKIGGYPKGAVLQSNDGASSYVSTIDGNTTDFNTDASSIGTSWLPWAGKAAQGGQGILFGGTAGGTSEIITATFEDITELTDGLLVSFRATAANTSTNPSFNASSLGALTIVKGADLPLAAGDIGGEGYLVLLQYSTTWNKWVLQNPATGINIVIPSAMPVGAIYVQFAGQTDPTTLFGGTWENVSSTYAGLFFRAEGGKAAAFGSTQTDGAPNITGTFAMVVAGSGNVNTGFESGAFSGYSAATGVVPSKYSTNSGNNAISFSAGNSNSVYGKGSEIRPVNSAVRIWERTG